MNLLFLLLISFVTVHVGHRLATHDYEEDGNEYFDGAVFSINLAYILFLLFP